MQLCASTPSNHVIILSKKNQCYDKYIRGGVLRGMTGPDKRTAAGSSV